MPTNTIYGPSSEEAGVPSWTAAIQQAEAVIAKLDEQEATIDEVIAKAESIMADMETPTLREEDFPDYQETVSDEIVERNLRAIAEAEDLSSFEIPVPTVPASK
jgi:hypothetical protein